MTAIDTTELENIANLSFNDFKAAHIVGNNVAEAYYNRLALEAGLVGQTNTANYASHAKAVVENDSTRGIFENEYAKIVAADNSIDLTYGTDNWLRVQYDKMQADLGARLASIGDAGTGELTYFETNAVLEASYVTLGLPSGTSPLFVPLSQLGEHDPLSAQAHFENYIAGADDGLIALMGDALQLAFGADVSAAQGLSGVLADWSNQAHWINTMLDAFENMIAASVPLDPGVQEQLDFLQALSDLAANELGQLAKWTENLPNLGQFLSIPDWFSGAHTPWSTAPNTGSPLILDLDGDGIELTTFNAATTESFFDIDGDDFAEQTAWITANQDGLLVRDINTNGQIDSVAELFGSPSIDGFALLAALDDNGDHLIDQYDSAWSDLKIWKDVDGDAVTQSGELLTLSSLSIVSIDLAGVTASASTINGNPISHTSTFKLSNGTTRDIVDAWFTHDNANTYYTGEFTVDARTLFLPTLRGFGTLPDLHIAMSLDEDLLDLVEEFAVGFTFETFDPANGLDQAVTDILYRWAGVDDVNPTSRGTYMDARTLGFLEAFFGENYVNWSNPNPGSAPSDLLRESFGILFETMKAHLLLQSGAASLFDDSVSYNPFTGEAEASASLSQAAIIDLEDFATAVGVDPEAYWVEVAKFVDATKGFDNLTSTENGWFDTSIVASDPGLTWTAIKALTDPDNDGPAINGTSGADTLNGTAQNEAINGQDGNDTLNGNAGADTLNGGSGDDALYGGTGDDWLIGGLNNDTLDGGAGNDLLEGSSGNDTYIYGSGDDVFYDTSGTNTVQLPSGIALGNLTIARIDDDTENVHGIMIEVGSLGKILLKDVIHGNGSILSYFSSIVFADTSTLNLQNLTSLITYGGQGDDTVSAVYGTSAINDTVYGLEGDDDLRGGDGNDTLDGGIGNDLLQGGAGNDTYYASPGFDQITESGGTDVIIMPTGIDLSDVELVRLSDTPNELYIHVDGLGQIFVDNQFHSSGYRVETIQFTGSSLDLTTTTIQTIGTSGNDGMYGIATGASTNDVFDGREGDDNMQGGAGNDIYYFSAGQDTVNESTGSSNDGIKFREGINPGDITMYRGGYQGQDLIFLDTNGNKLTVGGNFAHTNNLVEYAQFFGGTTWTFSSMEIETRGTSGNDDLYNNDIGDASRADTMYGYAGADNVYGGLGNDVIYGGDGADTITGDDDDDTLYGENDGDSIYGGTGNDVIYGGAGNDTMNGDSNNDTLDGGDGNDNIYGGSETDTVTYGSASSAVTVSLAITSSQNTVGAGWDTILQIENLTGSAYNDTLTGDTDANTIKGDAGNDTIQGGNGNDILYGGAGTDTLTGGSNADTFVFELASAFTNQDTITDFNTGQSDKIDISNVIEEFDPLTDAIADWVNFTNSGSDSVMSVDRDGTGSTYTWANVATLNGVTNLDETTLYNNGNLLAA